MKEKKILFVLAILLTALVPVSGMTKSQDTKCGDAISALARYQSRQNELTSSVLTYNQSLVRYLRSVHSQMSPFERRTVYIPGGTFSAFRNTAATHQSTLSTYKKMTGELDSYLDSILSKLKAYCQ